MLHSRSTGAAPLAAHRYPSFSEGPAQAVSATVPLALLPLIAGFQLHVPAQRHCRTAS